MENVFVVFFSVRGRMFLNVARKKVSENYSIRPTKSVRLENFSTLLCASNRRRRRRRTQVRHEHGDREHEGFLGIFGVTSLLLLKLFLWDLIGDAFL